MVLASFTRSRGKPVDPGRFLEVDSDELLALHIYHRPLRIGLTLVCNLTL